MVEKFRNKLWKYDEILREDLPREHHINRLWDIMYPPVKIPPKAIWKMIYQGKVDLKNVR